MNFRCSSLFILSLLHLFCFRTAFANDDSLTRELGQIGLPARISVRVRDQDGKLVPDADVLMSFSVHNQRESTVVEAKTDEEGIATGEARLNDRIAIHIRKHGYYETFFRYSPWKHGHYESGRWEFDSSVLDAIIYLKKHPINISEKCKVFHNLDSTKKYGFDVLAGRLLEPDDENGHADFTITASGSFYEQNTAFSAAWEKTVEFIFGFEGDGFIRRTRNMSSEFMFDYQAPLDGYANPVVYHSTRYQTDMNGEGFPTNEEYLVFRISRQDEKTGETVHYYGIIEDLGYGKDWDTNRSCFSIGYRASLSPNDQNIEFH